MDFRLIKLDQFYKYLKTIIFSLIDKMAALRTLDEQLLAGIEVFSEIGSDFSEIRMTEGEILII